MAILTSRYGAPLPTVQMPSDPLAQPGSAIYNSQYQGCGTPMNAPPDVTWYGNVTPGGLNYRGQASSMGGYGGNAYTGNVGACVGGGGLNSVAKLANAANAASNAKLCSKVCSKTCTKGGGVPCTKKVCTKGGGTPCTKKVCTGGGGGSNLICTLGKVATLGGLGYLGATALGGGSGLGNLFGGNGGSGGSDGTIATNEQVAAQQAADENANKTELPADAVDNGDGTYYTVDSDGNKTTYDAQGNMTGYEAATPEETSIYLMNTGSTSTGNTATGTETGSTTTGTETGSSGLNTDTTAGATYMQDAKGNIYDNSGNLVAINDNGVYVSASDNSGGDISGGGGGGGSYCCCCAGCKEGGLVTMMAMGGGVYGMKSGGAMPAHHQKTHFGTGGGAGSCYCCCSCYQAVYDQYTNDSNANQSYIPADAVDNGDGTYSVTDANGNKTTYDSTGATVGYENVNAGTSTLASGTPTNAQVNAANAAKGAGAGCASLLNTIKGVLGNSSVQNGLVGALLGGALTSGLGGGSSGAAPYKVCMAKLAAIPGACTNFGIGPARIVQACQYENRTNYTPNAQLMSNLGVTGYCAPYQAPTPVGGGVYQPIYQAHGGSTHAPHKVDVSELIPIYGHDEPQHKAQGGIAHYTFGTPVDPLENLNHPVAGLKHGGDMPHTLHSHQTNPVRQGRIDFKAGSAVNGPGTGQSDDIPAFLADGEYVIDADTVAALGDGSNKAGSKMLDHMREQIRAHKRSAPVDKIPPKAKSPLEYMKGYKHGKA